MASADWHFKIKSASQARGIIEHNEKDARLQHSHKNPHIDKSLTVNNYSYKSHLTVRDKKREFDDKLQYYMDKAHVRQSSGKNANTILQSILIYPPDDLLQDPDDVRRWFMRIGSYMDQTYGRQFLDLDVHVDEVHEYVDARTGETRMSRIHGHALVIPYNERTNKFGSKAFATRQRITSFNDAVEKITQEEFGCRWNNGNGKTGKKTVAAEQLKILSAQLQADKILTDVARIKADAQDMRAAADQERERNRRGAQAVQQARAELERRESDVDRKEKTMDQREKDLDQRQAALDQRESDLEYYKQDLQAEKDVWQANYEAKLQRAYQAACDAVAAKLRQQVDQMIRDRKLPQTARQRYDQAVRELQPWEKIVEKDKVLREMAEMQTMPDHGAYYA